MSDSLGTETQGRTKLATWMASNGKSQGFVAQQLGVSQPAVRGWLKGLTRPELHNRDALLVLCDIPTEDWETADEREKRAAAVERIRASASNPDPEAA